MTLQEYFESESRYAIKAISQATQLRVMAENAGILDVECSATLYTWLDKPELILNFYGEDAQERLHQTLRQSLNTFKRFEKKFDETTKQLEFSGECPFGVLRLRCAPPDTCTVEEYEEEVPETVVPKRTVKKFRMVGDCEPFLNSVSPAAARDMVEHDMLPEGAELPAETDFGGEA